MPLFIFTRHRLNLSNSFFLEEARKAEEAELKGVQKEIKRQKKADEEAEEQAARAGRVSETAGYVNRLRTFSLVVPDDVAQGKRLPQRKEMKALCQVDPSLASVFKSSVPVDALWQGLKNRISNEFV